MQANGSRRARVALLLAASLSAAALAGCVDASDTDRDGTLDDDNDGMPDLFETSAGLNPKDASDAGGDADGDGLSNVREFERGTWPLDPDGDKDGMQDGFEDAHGFNPLNASDGESDADGDGLSNAREAELGTDPQRVDSDGDTMRDGWEVRAGLNPSDPSDGPEDPDHDGLPNSGEAAAGAEPDLADTDNDTMPDGWEVANGLDPTLKGDAANDYDQDSFDADGDGSISAGERFTNAREFEAATDPKAVDSDGDQMSDGYEWLCGLAPGNGSDAGGDLDGDGLRNIDEWREGTLANLPDTDLDLMNDGFEARHGLDPRNASDAAGDLDGDGLDNLHEAMLGGDPTKPDTDGDGVLDGRDADPSRNVQVTLQITFVNVTFAAQPTETGFDPPWEFSFVLSLNGTEVGRANFTINAAGGATGENASLALAFSFDAFDGEALANLTLKLFELDLPETIGVNPDDAVDLDPAPLETALDFAVALWGGWISGDTEDGTVDGADDLQGGDHDARILFTVTLSAA